MPFGTTVADAANNEAWIKGFKDGVTRIRIVQELPTWIKYFQHYTDWGFYFPCEQEKSCYGCLFPQTLNDEGQPKRGTQYAFNAFDEKGNLGIYRIGVNAYKILKSRHDRLETLTDRDHLIVRSGKGFDTTYIPEPGDKYEVEMPDALLPILPDALHQKYEDAKRGFAKAYAEGSVEIATGWEIPELGQKILAGLQGTLDAPEKAEKPAEKAAEPKAAPKATEEPKAPETSADEAQSTTAGTTLDFDDMSTPEIKGWLEKQSVELPPRAARAALLKLAKEKVASAPY